MTLSPFLCTMTRSPSNFGSRAKLKSNALSQVTNQFLHTCSLVSTFSVFQDLLELQALVSLQKTIGSPVPVEPKSRKMISCALMKPGIHLSCTQNVRRGIFHKLVANQSKHCTRPQHCDENCETRCHVSHPCAYLSK